MDGLLINLSAVLALVPASLTSVRRLPARDTVFWLLMTVALCGAVVASASNLSGHWRTDFVTAIWVSVAASLAVFMVVAVLLREAWKLGSMVSTYLMVLSVIAFIWGVAADQPAIGHASYSGWIGLHIAVSVGTYALVTIAAVAAFGAATQERALKTKRQTAFHRSLPSVADCDRLIVQLLVVGEAVLAVGLISGMALQYSETGAILALNHKSILTLTGFLVIGCVLIAHYKSGLRGRKAARIVLLAYLLLTLGYPGVKFVSDILINA